VSDRPTTWAALLDRLAYLFGGGEWGAATAAEWMREAVAARYGSGLTRVRRQVAFQKALGVLWALEDEHDDLAFMVGTRAVVAAAVRRYFEADVVGPPWRLDPGEDRPLWEDWRQTADEFAGDAQDARQRAGHVRA
jgi:hypothetical protein